MKSSKKLIKAVMIGHAVADALGVPIEFRSREELDLAPVTEMTGFGTYPVPAGAWSDDTSMSLCAMAVLASGRVDYGKIMENFAKWCANSKYTPTNSTFDIGNTCLCAIQNYLSDDAIPATECGLSDDRSNGNGSLMRIHPFVLYAHAKKLPYEKWSELIKNGSRLTHAHARSVLGCMIYSFVLLALLEMPAKPSIALGLTKALHRLGDSPELSHYGRIFSDSFAALPREQIKSSGYVVDTLEAALWCLMTTENYRDCVLKAVNLGEDTDTVAAVAGGLAGALYGDSAIPTEWLDTLIRREDLEGMCNLAALGWM